MSKQFTTTKTEFMTQATNTIDLTVSQEENLSALAREIFISKVKTEDWNHFSFNGTCLNFNSMNHQGIFEIHTDKCGSFELLIDMNEKKKGLKKTAVLWEI